LKKIRKRINIEVKPSLRENAQPDIAGRNNQIKIQTDKTVHQEKVCRHVNNSLTQFAPSVWTLFNKPTQATLVRQWEWPI
jgi:hypothetical protein